MKFIFTRLTRTTGLKEVFSLVKSVQLSARANHSPPSANPVRVVLSPSNACNARLAFLVGSPVSGLCFKVCPSAIFWRVATPAIDAVKGQSFWTLTHILKKVKEVLPSITDGYSSTPVSWVIGLIRVLASRLHLDPSSVSRCIGMPVLWDASKVLGYNLFSHFLIPSKSVVRGQGVGSTLSSHYNTGAAYA